MHDFAYARAWRAIGAAGVAAVVVLSLVPLPAPPVEIEQGDKLGHLLAYFALTAWHAQLVTTRGALAARALAFSLLGTVLEALQSLTGWRHGNDPFDALANVAGVCAGFVLGLTPARAALAAFDARLAALRAGRPRSRR